MNTEQSKGVIEIRHRRTRDLIYTHPGETMQLAILSRRDLASADLRGVDLRDADLRDAELANADMTGANLTGTILAGASLRNAIMPDGRTWEEHIAPVLAAITNPEGRS